MGSPCTSVIEIAKKDSFAASKVIAFARPQRWGEIWHCHNLSRIFARETPRAKHLKAFFLLAKNKLQKDFKIKEDEFTVIETNIKKQIKEVEKFSLESPLPDLNELFTEVYL